MALKTHSAFYYGHVIIESNRLIPFSEGGPEIIAEIPIGSYTLTRFCEIVAASLNTVSALDWTCVVDRATGIVTLTASGAATLNFGSSPVRLSSCFDLLGFEGIDFAGTTFTGSKRSGSAYYPQFPLQNYMPKEKNKKLENAVKTKSADGESVSLQFFGVSRFVKFNIKNITNLPVGDGYYFKTDLEAVENATKFIEYLIEQNPVEFMPDESEPSVFDKLRLETLPNSADGTQYELAEYYDKGLPEWYETGLLTFKVITRE